ncbi:hypothetical protein, partial [Thermosyntropha lipolytica]|uniref:hypothetical protein n=1 Tax=Thermosyntropha lipolytica TaxID=54294 RepID=UPI001A9A587C
CASFSEKVQENKKHRLKTVPYLNAKLTQTLLMQRGSFLSFAPIVRCSLYSDISFGGIEITSNSLIFVMSHPIYLAHQNPGKKSVMDNLKNL